MNTPTVDIKSTLEIGTMYDANGNRFMYELAAMNRRTHYAITLEVFKGENKVANCVSEIKNEATNIVDVRKAWASYKAGLKACYTITASETDVKRMGEATYTTTNFKAEAQGEPRNIIATFHDGNEGSYSVTVDFDTMTVEAGGTNCPDVPAEYRTTPVPNRTEGLKAFNAERRLMEKRFYAETCGVTAVYQNWVRKEF